MPVTPIPFTPEMNWVDLLVEELEFETTVTGFYSGNEQREGLMETPHRRLAYSVSALEVQEAGIIEALAYAGQALPFWVPYWRGVSWLASALSIGNTTLALDTVNRGYEVGEGIMLIRDAVTAEVSVLSAVTDTSVTFAALAKNWGAAGQNRAKVVPVYRGLLAPSVDFDYAERSMKLTKVIFDLLPAF